MLNDRLSDLGAYPFRRLARLLADVTPNAALSPLAMSVGEPQLPVPSLAVEAIAANAALWNKYPPAAGTEAFRATVAGWLTRRYGLPEGMVDPERHILPCPGTREGLFQIALAVVPQKKAGQQPLVLMPNPFYQVYAGASAYAGAQPVYLPAVRETGFLPDLDALTPDILDRTALIYLCTPGNPQGTVADLAYLKRLITLARAHDIVVAVDECYAEIYDQVPPPGALEACLALGSGFENVVVFHSLSKRSSVPGLRSGFVAGDARIIAAQLQVVEYGGAPMPLPIMAAAIALWSDEAHVRTIRAAYAENFALAQRILGNRFGFYRPGGGFFLWLDVGDGEVAAKKLWGEAALRTLPGAYLARDDKDGRNPGQAYLRVALVHPPAITETGLSRLAATL